MEDIHALQEIRNAAIAVLAVSVNFTIIKERLKFN
jgi:hypothetical protein